MLLQDYAYAKDADEMRTKLGLDRPVHVQYVEWFGGLLRGDLGTSILTRRPVRDDLGDYFPATLELALWTIVAIVLIGIPLGVISATRRGGLVDLVTRLLATLWVAIPIFWFGLLLQLLFYLNLGWLPVGGRIEQGVVVPRITGLLTVDAALEGNLPALASALRHLVLPVTALALTRVAVVSRMTRASMLEVLGQPFVRTSRAYGLQERVIRYRVALRNALVPVTALFGLMLGYVLAGTVYAEIIFNRIGLGSVAVSAIGNRDWPVVRAAVLIYAIGFILGNLLADMAYRWLDPRLRLEERREVFI
jgi:peptide/nickel transport system permease protein